MRRLLVTLAVLLLSGGVLAPPAAGRDSPEETINLHLRPIRPEPGAPIDSGNTGGQFSKVQIEQFRCSSAGDPTMAVDMSCNSPELGQDWAPDNEIAVSVDPLDSNHV